MFERRFRPLKNMVERRPLRKLINRQVEQISEPVSYVAQKEAEPVIVPVQSVAQGGEGGDASTNILMEQVVPDNFPNDHDYTINALVEELTLAERHLRDGSWKLCTCITGDSLVYNSGEIKPINEVITEDGEYFIDNPTELYVFGLDKDLKVSPRKVTKLLRKRADNIIKIKTKTGRELKITDDNGVLFCNENYTLSWKPIKDVSTGERIGVPRNIPIINKTNIKPEIAYYLGLVDSDGCFTTQHTISFVNTNKDLIQKAEDILTKNKIKYSKTYRPPKLNRKIRSVKPSWMIRICSKKLYNKWKHLTQKIENTSREAIAAYLAGFFDGDGTVGKEHVRFYASSKEEADKLQRLLLRLGIVTYQWKHPNANEYAVNISNLISKKVLIKEIISFTSHLNKKEKMEVILTQEPSKHKVSDDIIPNFGEKLSKIKREKNLLNKDLGEPSSVSRRLRGEVNTSREMAETMLNDLGITDVVAFSDIFWDKIVSKTPCNPAWVYDFTVEETENFIANDIFIHNCNPEKHLPMIAGLASEGYGFTDDVEEKTFMAQLRDNARIWKGKIEKGEFNQRDADDLRAWTREMRHRITFKEWLGKMGDNPELEIYRQVKEPVKVESKELDIDTDFPDEEVPEYKYHGQLYLLTSANCPACNVMKKAMAEVIEDGTVIPTDVGDDVGYDIVSKLQLRAVPTLVLMNPDGSYVEVTNESQLTGL